MHLFTDRWEFIIESCWQTDTSVGSNKQVSLITRILDDGADVEVLCYHCRVGWLFRLAASFWLMLADVVDRNVTVSVRPKPSFRAIVSSTVLVPTRQIPEGNCNIISIQPLPVHLVLRISDSPHPILAAGVTPVPSPEFPADEALESRITFIDQSSTSTSAECERITKVERLSIVEDVALAIVRSCRSRWLVSELGTPFNRQCLVGVDEGLADGKLALSGGRLQVNTDESARHWGVAREEQGLALLQEPGESVADRVSAQVRPVVAHANDDGRRFVLATTGLSEVQADELDHVGFEEVDIPPGGGLWFGQRACFRAEERACGAVDGLLRHASQLRTYLHRRLSGRHVQHTKWDSFGDPLSSLVADPPGGPEEFEAPFTRVSGHGAHSQRLVREKH